jgi:hypothetical protein
MTRTGFITIAHGVRVPQAGQSSVLPLRPLTTAELLDAAVSLLRSYGRVLLPAGAVLAVAEQVLLAPLRAAAGTEAPYYGVNFDFAGSYWLLFAVGCGLEAGIIALLGGPAARAAAASLLGSQLSARELLRHRDTRSGAILVVALVAGLLTFVGALFGPLWALAYASVGLAVPALVIDQVDAGRAIRRGAGLAWRAGARAAGIRLLGYIAWLAIKLALGLLGVWGLDSSGLLGGQWIAVVGALVWLGVNVVAYPTLACLDAVLHLETRMRTEGLDIWLSRAATHEPLTPRLLAVGR